MYVLSTTTNASEYIKFVGLCLHAIWSMNCESTYATRLEQIYQCFNHQPLLLIAAVGSSGWTGNLFLSP